MTAELPPPSTLSGRIKWFDPDKGFGFIVSDECDRDVLLHANVLRNFGQSSVADGAEISVTVQHTQRGVQAVEVHSIQIAEAPGAAAIADFENIDLALFSNTPTEPARIKWFDKSKGFGFANVFGSADDIFIHVEVLRKSGFVDLQPGEAVSIQVYSGERGKLALTVSSWDCVKH